MYPYNILGDFDLYTVLIFVGAIGCLVLVRLLADRISLSDGLTNLTLASGIVGMALGYGAAVLFQAFYNFLASGEFLLGGGATFYGGLVGGAVGFLACYFLGGHFFCRAEGAPAHFFTVASLAACGITFAHGFGRLGCLAVGCCYGLPTDAWYGIYMVNLGYRVIPTQLIEAVFLFALCGLLAFLTLKGKRAVFALYLGAYGVFRFLLEFLRGDPRGASPVPFFTPSQLTAILMIFVAAALYLAEAYILEKRGKTIPAPADGQTEENP